MNYWTSRKDFTPTPHNPQLKIESKIKVRTDPYPHGSAFELDRLIELKFRGQQSFFLISHT